MLHFNALAVGDLPRISRQTLPLQKLECFSYMKLKTARSYLHSFGQNIGMWRKDGRTDRQNRSGYYSGLHCQQCGRAVKSKQSCNTHYTNVLCIALLQQNCITECHNDRHSRMGYRSAFIGGITASIAATSGHAELQGGWSAAGRQKTDEKWTANDLI